MKINQQGWKKFFFLFTGLFILLTASAQSGGKIKVTGIVKDEIGEPIIGASISEKGEPTNGTISDIDGNFTLDVAANGILHVSYIGYNTQDVPVNGKVNHTIVLKEKTELLNEVVVIGYGSVRKEDLTGSVAAIKVDELNKGLSTSPQDLLGGKIAGVSVISGGGEPGSGSTIRIRGGSSLSAKNDPLIVVDGVILSNENVGGLSNGLSTINPSDIETFTVLKDASSTAIYGSRASNGVIIITTKKGKSGKLKINYTGNVSVSSPRNKFDVLSGNEY
ncbi:MAG: TonB-dependent receptor plug domain-containing protein, partial [Tannerellaceae bacterium]